MDEKAMAVALRAVSRGLADLAAVLDGNSPNQDQGHRRLELMKRFDVPPSEGLTRAQASQALSENGYSPRSFGGWVRRGWIVREGDRRYLTEKGREFIAAQAAKSS
jgi:hypothetical protein